jgi:hypothetical protein
MNKKKWGLLILCAILIFGYIKLFYKTYAKNVIAQDADYIVALDVKRITNTFIWGVITHPSRWKISTSSTVSKTDEVSFRDMVTIPDYIFGFHIKNQPNNIWYTILQIKDEKNFEKGLKQFGFETVKKDNYFCKQINIGLIKNGNEILITNSTAEEQKVYLEKVANDMFVSKQFIASEIVQQVIAAKSHAAFYIPSNNFLEKNAIVSANFDDDKILINTTLSPNPMYAFAENNFAYNSSDLFALGFTQPPAKAYELLSDTDKNNISKAINVNVDSLLLPSNKYYYLNVKNILPRVDSAISYTYDDDFNQVEKVVVNNVQEPAFNFSIVGSQVNKIFSGWQQSKKLETAADKQLFTPMPFVKSYATINADSVLNITANNYATSSTDKKFDGIFFLNLIKSKIPTDLLKYLPDDVTNVLTNIDEVNLQAQKQSNLIIFTGIFYKKKIDQPILSF